MRTNDPPRRCISVFKHWRADRAAGLVWRHHERWGRRHLAPLTGASSLRRADLKNLFHLRASYTDETRRLVENIASKGIRKLAVVYLDNPYRKEVLGDVIRSLDAAGVKTAAQVAPRVRHFLHVSL